MYEKLVSIITPLYNGEAFVAQTIDSVLAQTYTNWEMIIINDGSKDNSENIVRGYCDIDHRIKLFNQPNAGSAAARNNGIRRAKGRYIALLDADDLWEPNFLEAQLALMQKHNAQLVYDTSKYGKVYLHEEFRSLRDDYIYWLEIIKQTGEAWGNQNIIGSYRILGNSVSRNKKKVIKPQFLVYYKVEKLGLIRSLYYLANWAIMGFLKYRK